MTSLAFIPILFFGFLFCKLSKITNLHLHKFKAQYFIYSVLYYGVGIFFVGFLLLSFIDFLLNLFPCVSLPTFYDILDGLFSKEEKVVALYILIISFVSFFVTLISAGISNSKSLKGIPKNELPIEFQQLYRLKQLYRNDPFKHKLIKNFIANLNCKSNHEMLYFEIDTGKVYVGFVYEMGFPDENTAPETLIICPVRSGYRDENKLLKITNDYEPILVPGKISDTKNKNVYETTIAIKESNITLVKDYIQEVFDKVKEEQDLKDKDKTIIGKFKKTLFQQKQDTTE